MDVTAYWDSEEGCQKERECTQEEQVEIDARRTAQPNASEFNAPILAQLAAIDSKSIRPLREGDGARVAALEAEAAALRAQLKK